jgi:hypothetical protein
MPYSTAANTTRFPFLSLPLEVRARIHDYVFYISIIHITPVGLVLCDCPNVYQIIQPRGTMTIESHSLLDGYKRDSPCQQLHKSRRLKILGPLNCHIPVREHLHFAFL